MFVCQLSQEKLTLDEETYCSRDRGESDSCRCLLTEPLAAGAIDLSLKGHLGDSHHHKSHKTLLSVSSNQWINQSVIYTHRRYLREWTSFYLQSLSDWLLSCSPSVSLSFSFLSWEWNVPTSGDWNANNVHVNSFEIIISHSRNLLT